MHCRCITQNGHIPPTDRTTLSRFLFVAEIAIELLIKLLRLAIVRRLIYRVAQKTGPPYLIANILKIP